MPQAVPADAEAFVARTIADPTQPVVMFALEWCEFCWSVRKLFAHCEIPFRSVDIDAVEFQEGDRGGKIRAAVSALTGGGIDRLLARIDEALRPRVERLALFIPYRDGPALALCYEKGRVLQRRDEAEGIRLEAEVPRRVVAQLEAYRSPA